ncbi:MAG: patatin-like phospholipase family protein [Candidatus Krumholzibacteriota bacterium]|nr:patatin-like phospholipase family protein [Candidatus Krumholzibacteriota bacterium]
MHRRIVPVATIVLFVFLAGPAGADPRVGVALSGGGARGLAHIGVLAVLEEAGVPVDVVAGTSMGGIVGALYATGLSPAELERIVVETDWLALFDDRPSYRWLSMRDKERGGRHLASAAWRNGRLELPTGLLRGDRLHALFTRLTWPCHRIADFRDLPRPFACVATDIATGEAVVLDGGFLPDAMRATMSIPSLFTPYELDGRLLVDGGLVRNLPADDAVALGADIVIGVDVGSGLLAADSIRSIVDILVQSTALLEARGKPAQIKRCDIVISPRLDGIGTTDYHRAAEIVRRGEEAARANLDAILRLTGETRAIASAPAPPAIDTLQVVATHVDGLRRVSEGFVDAALGFVAPAAVPAVELDRALDRLRGSGLFRDIRWRALPEGGGERILVDVTEDNAPRFMAGLRYDDRYDTSLLLGVGLRNTFGHSSSLDIDVRLGRSSRFETAYGAWLGSRWRFGIEFFGVTENDEIDVYERGERTAVMDAVSARAGLAAETAFSSFFSLRLGAASEHVRIDPVTAPGETAGERIDLLMLTGELIFDTLDDRDMPHRGVQLRVAGETTTDRWAGDRSYRRGAVFFRVRAPLGRRLTLAFDGSAGTTEGDETPLPCRFFLGGMNSWMRFGDPRRQDLPGLKHFELSGRHAIGATAGIEFEVLADRYVRLIGGAGVADDDPDALLDIEHVAGGGGVTLAWNTIAGPVEWTVSGSRRHHLMTFLSIGRTF